jgi:hypothetical protein
MELLLAVGIMTVLVAALYGMFHHTQRALRANVTQVDVLEVGRATMDVLTRDLAQMCASRQRGETNLHTSLSPLVGFGGRSVAELAAMYYVTNPPADLGYYQPVVQTLMTGSATRTNRLQEVYYLSRYGERFIGTSYRVIGVTNGVGTLARLSRELPVKELVYGQLSSNVLAAPAVQYAPLADGVIHFRLRLYDTDGFPFEWQTADRLTNRVLYPAVLMRTNLFLYEDRMPSETTSAFLSNALPSYVEIELAVVEPKTLDQLRAFAPGSAMAGRFLANHAAQVHVFRQRVAIRQAPPIQAVQALP